MGMKKCPICGEKFSDTYKCCPFCEEEENPDRVRQPKRWKGGGKRLAINPIPVEDAPDEEEPAEEEKAGLFAAAKARRERRRREREDEAEEYDEDEEDARDDTGYDEDGDDGDDGGDDDDRSSPAFKIAMVILIAIIIVCLLYLGRGIIGSLVNHDGDTQTPPSSMMSSDEEGNASTQPPISNGEGTDTPDDTQTPDQPDENVDTDTPDDTQTPDANGDTQTAVNTDALSESLTLNKSDVTIAGDETFTLTATGASKVTYQSADPTIASVSSSGVVTGLKKGMTEIVVISGNSKGTCIVRVKSNSAAAGSNTPSAAETTPGNATLSKDDVTASVGESFTLRVSGTDAAVSWSTGNSAVATVSGGQVTAVGSGTTTVTATVNGQTLSCIVRVK